MQLESKKGQFHLSDGVTAHVSSLLAPLNYCCSNVAIFPYFSTLLDLGANIFAKKVKVHLLAFTYITWSSPADRVWSVVMKMNLFSDKLRVMMFIMISSIALSGRHVLSVLA